MVYCFASQCTCSDRGNTKKCSFHRFPKDCGQRMYWENLCRRKDRGVTDNDRLCSCHFKDGKKKNGPSIFNWNKHDKDKIFDFPELPRKQSKSRKEGSMKKRAKRDGMATAQLSFQPRAILPRPPNRKSPPSADTHSVLGEKMVTIRKGGKSYLYVNVVINGVMYKILVPSKVRKRPFTMQYTTRCGKMARFNAMPQTTILLKPPVNFTPRPQGPGARIISITPGTGALNGPSPAHIGKFDNEEVTEGVDDAFMFHDVEEYEATLLEDTGSSNTQEEPIEQQMSSAGANSPSSNIQRSPTGNTTTVTTNTMSSVNIPQTVNAVVMETRPSTVQPSVGITAQNETNRTTSIQPCHNFIDVNGINSMSSGKDKDRSLDISIEEMQSTEKSPTVNMVNGDASDDATEDRSRKGEESRGDFSEALVTSRFSSDCSLAVINHEKRKSRPGKQSKGHGIKQRRKDSNHIPHKEPLDGKDLALSSASHATNGISLKDLNLGIKFPPKVKLQPCSVVLKKLPLHKNTSTSVQSNSSGIKDKALSKDLISFMKKRLKMRTKHIGGSAKASKRRYKSRLSEKSNSNTHSPVVNNVCSNTPVTTSHSVSNAGSRSLVSPVVNQNRPRQALETTLTTTNGLMSTQSLLSAPVPLPVSTIPSTSSITLTCAPSTALANAGNSDNKYVLIKTNAGNFLVPVNSPLVTQGKNLSPAASAAVTLVTNTQAPLRSVMNGVSSTNTGTNTLTLTAARGATVLSQPIRMPFVQLAAPSTSTPSFTTPPPGDNAANKERQEKQCTGSLMKERIRRLKEMLRQKEQEVEIFQRKRSEDDQ